MPDETTSQPADPPTPPSPAAGQENTDANPPTDNQVGHIKGEIVQAIQAGQVSLNSYSVFSFASPDKKSGKKTWNSLGIDPKSWRKRGKVGQAIYADPSSKVTSEEELANTSEQTQEPKKLPETLDDTHKWYRNLTPIEKCFVQAMALLSGAPEHEIRRAVDELYRPVREMEEKLLQARIKQAIQNGGSQYVSGLLETPPITLDSQFLGTTYTIVRQFDQARRIFWQDSQPNGHSPFSILVLKIIEQEVPLGGYTLQVGQKLLERLELLPGSIGGESPWRVARALGALWVESDENRLSAMADSWARDTSSDDYWGWHVGHLLEGAFAVEYNKKGERAYQYDQSVVLSLLSDWTRDVHSDGKELINIKLGCTIAMTFRLLGVQHPQIALKGFDELLCFPYATDDNELIPEDILVAIVSAYAILTTYGKTREVLKNLAERAEFFAHQRQDIRWRNKLQDIRDYRSERFSKLIALLYTFILLVGSSVGPLQEVTTDSYIPPSKLAEYPKIPDNHNIDILLTGIIASEEIDWHKHISSILCTFFVEGSEDIALTILRLWAEEVLTLRGIGALKVRRTYLNFVVAVIKQAEQWSKDLRSRGFQTRPVLQLTCIAVKRWQRESQQQPNPLDAFAEDLLRQFKSDEHRSS